MTNRITPTTALIVVGLVWGAGGPAGAQTSGQPSGEPADEIRHARETAGETSAADATKSPAAAPDTKKPPAAAPAKAPAATEAGEIENIVITADRREKQVQDYAGSATAFTQRLLDKMGVDSVRRLSNAVPALQIGIQEGNIEVFIRGVGSDNNTELGDPAAATHIDGVYIPRPRGVGSMFFDLERVEVNRGPQGTLRGRNATAGSLNIITVKPQLEEFAAEASLQFGNYSQRLTRAMINVPLGDKLALRVATFTEFHDPFFKNGGPVTSLAASDSADTLAYRASAQYEPTDRIRINLSQDFVQEKGTGYAGTDFGPAFKAGLRPEDIPDWRSVVYRGHQGSQRMEHWGVRGDVTIDLGPVQVAYLGSYRDLLYRQNTGGTAGVYYHGMGPVEIDNYGHTTWRTTSQSHVHELRLYAPDNARLKWTAGGFLFYEEQEAFFGGLEDQSAWYVAGEFNMPDVKGKSYAGFLDAIFDLTNRLRLTGGARFTYESKSRTGIAAEYSFPNPQRPDKIRLGTEGFAWAAQNRVNYDISTDPRQFFRDGIMRYGARDTLEAQFMAPGTGTQHASILRQEGSYDDWFFDFRVGVDYDLSPDNLLYLSFSTGHKSGGFNDNLTPEIALTYKPESLYAVELGSKNELFNKKLRLNAALFDYEYRDQAFQNIVPVMDPHDPKAVPFSAAVRDNAAESRIFGLELEGRWHLPFRLVAGVQGLLMDAKFGEGEAREPRIDYGTKEKVSLKGNWLPKASRLTINYSLGQTILTPLGMFDWLVMAQTRSKYYMTIFNGEGTDTHGVENPNLTDVNPTYTRVDLNLGYSRYGGGLRVDAFVNNLTDAIYMTSLITAPGLNSRFFNPPRQFGVRVEMTWD